MKKKIKILFADPFSWEGHLNFNRIHIEALLSLDQEVEFSFIEGYGDKLGLNDNNVMHEIPVSLSRGTGKIGFRISQYRILKYLKRLIDRNKYDKIILSCYEPVSFLLSDIRSVYVINHNTITSNRIKKLCLKKINKYNIHLYMMRSIKEYFDSLGCDNIQFINHGILKPRQLPFYQSDKRFIFSPSASSSDFDLLKKILNSQKFINYLETNGFELIIRSNEDLGVRSKAVRFITTRLTEQEYMSEMSKAYVILICYPESFTYRVSGVLMEALAYNKRIIANEIPALTEFEGFIGSNFFYRDENTLIEALNLLKQGDINRCKLDPLTPDYSFLLQ